MSRNGNPNRIGELRANRNLSQSDLAEKVGAHWVTISKLERGQMQLTYDWMRRIAAALEVDIIELIDDKPSEHYKFELFGALEEKGKASRGPQSIYFRSADVRKMDPQTEWMIVEGDFAWPYYHDGDFIRFITIPKDHIQKYVGRLSIVIDIKNQQKMIFGYLENLRPDGMVDIMPFDAAPIRNISPLVTMVACEVKFAMSWIEMVDDNQDIV